jgi:hypothetical protein
METTTAAFQVNAADNVATLLGEAGPGTAIELLGPSAGQALAARDRIAMGHKIALRTIDAGDAITKFGVVIGLAARTIEPGEWVHLHNCHSQLDERSGSFDLFTGAPRENEHA